MISRETAFFCFILGKRFVSGIILTVNASMQYKQLEHNFLFTETNPHVKQIILGDYKIVSS